jgi:hypothetical protein
MAPGPKGITSGASSVRGVGVCTDLIKISLYRVGELLGGARLTRLPAGLLVELQNHHQQMPAFGLENANGMVTTLVDGVAVPAQYRQPLLDGHHRASCGDWRRGHICWGSGALRPNAIVVARIGCRTQRSRCLGSSCPGACRGRRWTAGTSSPGTFQDGLGQSHRVGLRQLHPGRAQAVKRPRAVKFVDQKQRALAAVVGAAALHRHAATLALLVLSLGYVDHD